MIDFNAPRYGLPESLWIPIAAVSPEAIEKYVGRVVQQKDSREGEPMALKVEAFDSVFRREVGVEVWKLPEAAQRLHPKYQVWVHARYGKYRDCYIGFGMPPIPSGYFLDHVQNREAIGARRYSHPYLRLCPVSHKVNTSGGHSAGGEGLEKEYVRGLRELPRAQQQAFAEAIHCQVVYADPMDLTKMLNVPPGTAAGTAGKGYTVDSLGGVRRMHALFFPSPERV